jgi:hypothetical protein
MRFQITKRGVFIAIFLLGFASLMFAVGAQFGRQTEQVRTTYAIIDALSRYENDALCASREIEQDRVTQLANLWERTRSSVAPWMPPDEADKVDRKLLVRQLHFATLAKSDEQIRRFRELVQKLFVDTTAIDALLEAEAVREQRRGMHCAAR